MKEKCKVFEDIASDASAFLKGNFSRSDKTVSYYNYSWSRIKKFMESNKIKYFDSSVGKKYLLEEFGDYDYSKLSKQSKTLVRRVQVLCEFYETGSIQPLKERTSFDGAIGQLMLQFLSSKESARLSTNTTGRYEQQLYLFLRHLNKNNISSAKAINQSHVLHFIKGINPAHESQIHYTITILRGFFKYLYDQDLLSINLAALLPKDNYKKQPKLPSTYSEKEIEKMIESIDRGNAIGKRNYAIVLLAARLGLRASDIANLKFENLLWEKCLLVTGQYKTGKRLELPILPEVGNAIIDYLKYGRQKSDEHYVFLSCHSPYNPIHNFSITGIICSCLVKAGINIENRKHGSHALRHSLAAILLEKDITLPVISEVLGHESTQSTSYYLRIDLKSMRQCALEVPLVTTAFYRQKGGYLYV